MYCDLIGHATRYLFDNRYRVTASNKSLRPSLWQKDNASSFFGIILKKIMNRSLFLLKQLGYLFALNSSMKRYSRATRQSLAITSEISSS